MELVISISGGDLTKRHFSKSKLSDLKRRTMATQMVLEMRSASCVRSIAAGERKSFEDMKPATLPRLDTIRKAKNEAVQSGRLHPDLIMALFMLQDSEL